MSSFASAALRWEDEYLAAATSLRHLIPARARSVWMASDWLYSLSPVGRLEARCVRAGLANEDETLLEDQHCFMEAVRANRTAPVGALSSFQVCRKPSQGSCGRSGTTGNDCWFHHSHRAVPTRTAERLSPPRRAAAHGARRHGCSNALRLEFRLRTLGDRCRRSFQSRNLFVVRVVDRQRNVRGRLARCLHP